MSPPSQLKSKPRKPIYELMILYSTNTQPSPYHKIIFSFIKKQRRLYFSVNCRSVPIKNNNHERRIIQNKIQTSFTHTSKIRKYGRQVATGDRKLLTGD
jgi:hypothetical protein